MNHHVRNTNNEPPCMRLRWSLPVIKNNEEYDTQTMNHHVVIQTMYASPIISTCNKEQ